MQLLMREWTQIFPDSDTIKQLKIKLDKKDKIIYPLPEWFKHNEQIEITNDEFIKRINILLNLNFYIMLKKFTTYTILYIDTNRFAIR